MQTACGSIYVIRTSIITGHNSQDVIPDAIYVLVHAYAYVTPKGPGTIKSWMSTQIGHPSQDATLRKISDVSWQLVRLKTHARIAVP